MLNLPKSTEVRKQIAKEHILKAGSLTAADKKAFNATIEKLVITNELLAHNVNIEASDEVAGFYVLAVHLKMRDYDVKVIEKIFQLINQKLVLVLQFENSAQLAVHHSKLFVTDWKPLEDLQLKLQGLNFAQVWTNVILQVSGLQIEKGNTLDKQLAINDARAKLNKQIELLKKKAWSERQPKKKFAYAQEVKVLERKLEEL